MGSSGCWAYMLMGWVIWLRYVWWTLTGKRENCVMPGGPPVSIALGAWATLTGGMLPVTGGPICWNSKKLPHCG